jgi:hypothetical protein
MNKHAITQDEVIGEAATERSHRTVAGIEVVEYTYAEGEPDESLPLPGASAPLPVARTSGSDRSPDQRSERVAQLEQECSRLLNQLSQARQDADERIREYDKRISALLSHINERDYELLEKDSKIATLTLAQAGSRETIADDPVPTEGLMVGAVAVHDRRDDVVESLKQRLGERGHALAVAREEFAELERERARLADALAERGQQVAQLLAQLTRIEVGRGFRMDFHSGLRRLLHLDPAVATGSTDSQSGNWQASEEPTIVLEESSGPKPEEDSLPATGRAKGDGQAGNEAKTAAVKLRRYLLPLKPDVDPVFELSGPRVYVGRGVAADVCISHPTISRLHGVLYFIGGATMLEDARSSNGIFVNQQRVQQAVLKDGDVVSFGNVAFHFRVAVSDS